VRHLPKHRRSFPDECQHPGDEVVVARPLGDCLAPLFELLRGGGALLHEERLHGPEPVLVVARRQVARGRNSLPRVAHLVEVRDAAADDGHGDAEDAPLPVGVEDRLLRFDLHRSEPVGAAEVVGAVH
jgi:hypothetical protein